MKNKKYIFLMLVISWTCFTIGCGITAAYLEVYSDYSLKTQTTKTLQTMRIQKQEDLVEENADVNDLSVASVKYFIASFYQYLKAGNRTELIKMVEDIDSFYSEDELRKIKTYVEDYESLQYYIEETSRENEYIVFVYFQIKLYDIDTLVPSISQHYVKMKNGEWKIYNNIDHLDQLAQKELKASLRLTEMKELIEDTNEQYQKIIKSEPELQTYFEESE